MFMVKVTVFMLTYNHEKYIEEAIESVLMQKTNFKFELVIGEDCSTDNTRNIILEYQKRYPDIIKVKLQEKNTGGRKNFISTFPMCKGEYIAFLEGDDYWIDENKLQKQVEYLDNNLDCSFCGHSYKKYSEIQNKFLDDAIFESNKFDLEDYLIDSLEIRDRRFYIRTLTIMFRKSVLDNPPIIWEQVPYGDYLLFILCLEKGKGSFVEDIMGVYRINSDSMTQRDPDKFFKSMIEIREMVIEYLPKKYKKYIIEDIEYKVNRKRYLEIIHEFECDKNDLIAREYFQKNNLKNIAIYGVGILGKILIEKLQNTNISIDFLIDRDSELKAKNLIRPEQIDENIRVDAIIVTAIFEFESIKEFLLSRNVKGEIISVNDMMETKWEPYVCAL